MKLYVFMSKFHSPNQSCNILYAILRLIVSDKRSWGRTRDCDIYIYGDCIKVTGHFSENIFFSRNFYRDKHVMHVHAYATLHK